MRLAVLTGLYVGVVCATQIGAQKIIAKYAAPLLVGLPLVLGLRRLVPQDERNIVAAQA